RLLGEAVGSDGALGNPEALSGTDRGLSPGAIRDSGNQVVPVTGLGLGGPLPQPADLGFQPGTGAGVEQRAGFLLLGIAVIEAVETQVVAPALQDRVARCPAERFT